MPVLDLWQGDEKMINVLVPAKSTEDWQRLLAEPKKHWKTGYSAKALASCWQKAKGFPKSVQNVFSQYGKPFDNIEPLLIIPEHKVPLPGGYRPSQNDIWILARSRSELVSITVEGKVSEPFGPTIGEWLNHDSKGKRQRLQYLCNELNLKKPIHEMIRYQLLHRTASAIIEAKRFNAKHAMMLVHSFSQKDEWFDDYDNFLSLFGLKGAVNKVSSTREISSINLYLAWIKGEM
ncbi:MAG: DUF6946 family protein [Candidatus Thorarchaeota archaeon]